MFGYVNINQESLSKEDKKAYQAYYCGLCRRLKTNCGTRGQMMLAYDMTFLIVLLTGLYELPDEKQTFSCAIHPGKKRTAFLNEATDYAADMNLILGYHNLLDDYRDDGKAVKKKLADKLESDYQKAAMRHPSQVKAVTEYLQRLSDLESERTENMEAAATVSGEILSSIFAWRDDEWADELRCLGLYLGKFIYYMDAYEDREKDRKSNSYNPLIALYKDKSPEEYEILCRCLLTTQARECAMAFERLPVLLHAEILRNVLYSGIWSKYEILNKKKKRT